MPLLDLVEEARRQMTVCNACRYCEGFCAVFPAMERRRTFSAGDMHYLANLCHECRGCYYACQYAEPHEFSINVPRALAELRQETYRKYTPTPFRSLFERNPKKIAIATLLSVVALLAYVLLSRGAGTLVETSSSAGAFYDVVPHTLMVVAPTLALLFAASILAFGAFRFWQDSGGTRNELLQPRVWATALRNVATLRYLGGGGDGCNYPDDRFSQKRRVFHQFVLYGFLLDFLSTSVAAFYEQVLDRVSPHPYFSPPVVLGTVGGLGLLVGCVGLLVLKHRSDTRPESGTMHALDLGFLWLLAATSLTGLLLLALRETAAMGSLLVIHLGVVGGLFLMLPFSKFPHAIYRAVALLRSAAEETRGD